MQAAKSKFITDFKKTQLDHALEVKRTGRKAAGASDRTAAPLQAQKKRIRDSLLAQADKNRGIVATSYFSSETIGDFLINAVRTITSVDIDNTVCRLTGVTDLDITFLEVNTD